METDETPKKKKKKKKAKTEEAAEEPEPKVTYNSCFFCETNIIIL